MELNKNDIAKRIQELQDLIESSRNEWSAVQVELKMAQAEAKTRQKQVEAAVNAYNEAAERARKVKTSSDQLSKIGKESGEEIKSLQRQLSRILDAETIEREYTEQYNRLRDATLAATWRKENRADGEGAKAYQIDGAIHLAVSKTGLLGDEMGLGKTLTSIIWADILDLSKVIIITPNATQDNFARELRKWAPHRAPIKIGNMPKGQRDFILDALSNMPTFVLIVNYEAWRKDAELIRQLAELQADALILDEAHYIKSSRAVMSEGVIDLRFAQNLCECASKGANPVDPSQHPHELETEYSSIKYVLPMTGTAILNKPQDLFNLLHIIDREHFPTLWAYLNDYCYKDSDQKWRWKYGAEERVMKLIGPRYLKRTQESVGLDLPPVKPLHYTITMDDLKQTHPRQWEAYRQIRDYGELLLNEQQSMPFRVYLELLLRLRQVLVWPAAISMTYEAEEGLVYTVNCDVHESVKVDTAVEISESILDMDDRGVIFSQFKPGLHVIRNELEKKGIRAVVYDGDTPSHLRKQIEEDFDITLVGKNPRWDIVLANYKTGGLGLNFTAANHIIRLDREWNPGKEDQALGRIKRIGQTKVMHEHIIEVDPSVDMWMASLIDLKREIVDGFEAEADIVQKLYEGFRNGEI